MDEKVESATVDLNKICRTCLTNRTDMRSLFLPTQYTSNASLSPADMIGGISSIKIHRNDNLPSLICIQCVQQLNNAHTFKQLCEQSDCNLRQFLGLPLSGMIGSSTVAKDIISLELPDVTEYANRVLLDTLEAQISDSDESDRESNVSEESVVHYFNNNTNMCVNEKLVAQKQLLKSTLQQKRIGLKKKLLLPRHFIESSARYATFSGKLKRSINQCKVCKKQFSNIKAFRKHLRSHIEDRPFKCKLCFRGFTELNYLNNHMRTHLPDEQKPHVCEFCSKRFIHINLLEKHRLKHSGEKPFRCKVCNKGCYAENSLLKHMKIHEKKEGDPALLKNVCDYCKCEFQDMQSLSAHIKQHSGDRPFVCNVCGKCFPQRFNLELHLRTHTGERPFKCEICKNGYVSKASLKTHMRTHTNERPFKCGVCGKAFRQSGDLTSHKRLHGTDAPIECDVCRKRFTTVMKLKYHMRNHTGERPYVCSVCGRGFTVNTILLRHMRTHSGERPYVCVTCGKAFSQSSTLNTHMKVHENNVKFDGVSARTNSTSDAKDDSKYRSCLESSKVCTTLVEQHLLHSAATDSRLLHQVQQSHLVTAEHKLLDSSSLLGLTDAPLFINIPSTSRLPLLTDSLNGGRLLVNSSTDPTDRLTLGTDTHRLLADPSRAFTSNDTRHLDGVVNAPQLLDEKFVAHYENFQAQHL